MSIGDRWTANNWVGKALRIYRKKIYIRWCCIDRLSPQRFSGAIQVKDFEPPESKVVELGFVYPQSR
jgi:hypothetical protein